MDDFLQRVSTENPEIVKKLVLVKELSDDLFSNSPALFKEYLQLFLNRYGVLDFKKNEKAIVNSSCQTDIANDLDAENVPHHTPDVTKNFAQNQINKDQLRHGLIDDHTTHSRYKHVNTSCQTDEPFTKSNDWDLKNIVNNVTSEASINIENSGFIYDHTSGLYYDYKNQGHYNPENTSCQTDEACTKSNDWDLKNIVDDVTSEASKNIENSGFIYDHTSGLYYDFKNQCHYNPETKLYYYHSTRSYYRYDQNSGCLQYYCSVPEDTNENGNSEQKVKQFKDKDGQSSIHSIANECHKESEMQDIVKNTMEHEEGECSSSDESDRPSPLPAVIESEPKPFEPDHSKHIAPCIRILVKSTKLRNLQPGTLFIVTCTGGTLGREGDHDVLVPDQLVSKLHSTFHYVYKGGSYVYEITDMGSRNGTFLDGKRLSDPLVESLPFEVTHGSIITVGSTDLLCHIHPKDDICDDCLGYTGMHDKTVTHDSATALSIKDKHSFETMAIRKKFGLLSSAPPKLPEGYIDRSLIRRKTVGSSHSSEKTQSSSVDTAVDKKNKGFAMLTKMGWKEGSSLGKTLEGLTEPISVEIKEGKQGFGSESTVFGPSTSEATSQQGPIFRIKKEKKKKIILEKTRDRYQKLEKE